MKEWQKLLDYIDSYIYVTDKEEISIVYNEKASEASRVYQHFLKEAGENKWEFDIALDCVRQMDEASREMILKQLNYYQHHFGVGMVIRNHYVHPSVRHGYFEAENISGTAFGIILTILHPYYDFRNGLLVSVLEDLDFDSIKELYQEEFGDVIEEKLMDFAKEPGGRSCEEALEELGEALREASGKEFFKRKFVEMVQELRRQGELKTREGNSRAFQDALYRISILYPLESQQLKLLFETDLRWEIERGDIKNIEECRQYIDQKVGFKEVYTDFLAQCYLEAFQEQ